MAWVEILESFIRGKHPDPDLCEDRLVLANRLAAVVDGATDKFRRQFPYQGRMVSSGWLAAQLVLAKDGFPLSSPYYVDTLDVAPGERYTVLVLAELPGTWVWHCHIFSHVEKPDGTMFGMLTALIVEE